MFTAHQDEQIDRLLALALAEDVGDGDVTTTILANSSATLNAVYVARQNGVLSGGEILRRFFRKLSPALQFTNLLNDGDNFTVGAKILRVIGNARALLTGERLSLNILQRMCGIATITRQYVNAIKGTPAKIYDTRKTLPGHRALDKMAVMHGGGENHRCGLYDMILIKDNHLALSEIATPAQAVQIARAKSTLPIMIEVDNLTQLENVLPTAPDYILLDNMDANLLKRAVKIVDDFSANNQNKRPQLEASGGITLNNIRAIAESGVERISVGALTHSVTALDIGLDYEE